MENVTFNTGETHEELRNRYNPEGSVLRLAQLRMLDMLIYLDRVCKEIGVEYVLEGGNALGAVRHGGFIPWDDDIDIDMTFDDYRKLCRYLLANPHPQYKLQTHETDPGYFGDWAVLRDLNSEYLQDSIVHNIRTYRGLQVDIFPLEKNSFYFLHRIASGLSHINEKYFVGKKRIPSIIMYHILHKFVFPLFRLIDKLNYTNNYYMYCYGHGGRVKLPENILFPPKEIIFEGKSFLGPRNINDYLTTFFGDYKELPPKENRHKHNASYIVRN